jgi:hypothetical protein
MSDQIDIHIMYRTKVAIETFLEFEDPNHEIIEIYKLVQEYMKKYCDHSFITDTIDNDVDVSETIEYCTKCFMNK